MCARVVHLVAVHVHLLARGQLARELVHEVLTCVRVRARVRARVRVRETRAP